MLEEIKLIFLILKMRSLGLKAWMTDLSGHLIVELGLGFRGQYSFHHTIPPNYLEHS